MGTANDPDPNHGIWAVGRYTFRTTKDTTYYWKVRVSQTGDAGSWVTVDNYLPPDLLRSSLGGADAFGVAASRTHVFVSGNDNNGSTWRWVVRRKQLGSSEPFTNVLSVPTAGMLRSRICYFPGNEDAGYLPAVLTIGKTASTKTGKTAQSFWAIRRSLDGGATFTEEHRWGPATAGFQAIPVDIACDPNTGYIYAVGGLAGSLAPAVPNSGWVIRVNRHGGDPAKWETLIETTSQKGTAQRIAFGPGGTIYVYGNFDPTGSSPYAVVISNAEQTWAESWLAPTYPFGFAQGSVTSGDLGMGSDGKLYFTGEVTDYVDRSGQSFPGKWLALARLTVP